MLESHRRSYRLPICTEKWLSKLVIAIIFAAMLMMLLFIFQPFQSEVHVLVLNPKAGPVSTTNEKFLSVALQSSLILEGFDGFNMMDTKLLMLIEQLGGTYLRIGGKMADRLIFEPNGESKYKSRVAEKILDGDDCSFEYKYCSPLDSPNFTMSGSEWDELNKLAVHTNFTILFDLNCLLRNDDGSWNASNAESLIAYSNARDYNIMWELGNEPNSFKFVFDYEVSPEQLADDFMKLREILDKHSNYKDSILVGPDVTRPKLLSQDSSIYLSRFLKALHPGTINAITWHQYYFNGRDAFLYYFLNPETFNDLEREILLIKEVVNDAEYNDIPIWLGETASAYGGGSPAFSDKFVSTFIWLDKLGLAAKHGMGVVVRQSLYQGSYALINKQYEPNPDWWISVLYKKLVGHKVVECFSAVPIDVRLYCHCNGPNNYAKNEPAITVFGMNLKNSEAVIRIQEADADVPLNYQIYSFILQTHISLISRFVFLNEVLLILENGGMPELEPIVINSNTIVIPPFSLGFWIIPSKRFSMCDL